MQCFGPCQGAIISAIHLALFYCCPLQCPTASNLKADCQSAFSLSGCLNGLLWRSFPATPMSSRLRAGIVC